MGSEHNDRESLPPSRKRTRIVRSYPNFTLQETLSIPTAIQEFNSGLPVDRGLLARELGTTPSSSTFIMKINSSARYGLTVGGYNDPQISLTPLGKSAVAPEGQEELRGALRQAALYPEVFKGFYEMLDGKRMPEDPFSQNMLQRKLSVNPAVTRECLSILKANGLFAGIVVEAEDSLKVILEPSLAADRPAILDISQAAPDTGQAEEDLPSKSSGPMDGSSAPRRLFVGHSGPSESVSFVSALLEAFELEYGAVQGEASDAQPVPREVSDEMRRCTAAVLIFDSAPSKKARAGQNPLGGLRYMLGAASVLYGDRIVIFAETRFATAEWPTEIQRVLFEGDRLEASGLELLKALYAVGAVKVAL